MNCLFIRFYYHIQFSFAHRKVQFFRFSCPLRLCWCVPASSESSTRQPASHYRSQFRPALPLSRRQRSPSSLLRAKREPDGGRLSFGSGIFQYCFELWNDALSCGGSSIGRRGAVRPGEDSTRSHGDCGHAAMHPDS